MTIAKLLELPVGVYRLHWRSGGTSVAAIGCTESGDKWIAPANWVSPLMPADSVYNKYVKRIKDAVIIERSWKDCAG